MIFKTIIALVGHGRTELIKITSSLNNLHFEMKLTFLLIFCLANSVKSEDLPNIPTSEVRHNHSHSRALTSHASQIYHQSIFAHDIRSADLELYSECGEQVAEDVWGLRMVPMMNTTDVMEHIARYGHKHISIGLFFTADAVVLLQTLSVRLCKI